MNVMNENAVLENAVPTATKASLGYDYAATKKEILEKYGVVPSELFDAKAACERRVAYLKGVLRSTGRKGFVLGISGGVDSTTTGRLLQLACEELRAEGYPARFYAVRLPAGVQRDEADAQEAIRFIGPDETMTVNVGDVSSVMSEACVNAIRTQGSDPNPSQIDYHKGNIKARMRMIVQYHFAAFYEALVCSTDHNGEACAGFWTTAGDGQNDLLLLNGLNKRQVRLCAKYLGAPERLWNKAPTADLEELNPGKLDDDGFGYSYEAQNDFLEGKPIDLEQEAKIIARYEASRFKREPSVEFPG